MRKNKMESYKRLFIWEQGSCKSRSACLAKKSRQRAYSGGLVAIRFLSWFPRVLDQLSIGHKSSRLLFFEGLIWQIYWFMLITQEIVVFCWDRNTARETQSLQNLASAPKIVVTLYWTSIWCQALCAQWINIWDEDLKASISYLFIHFQLVIA